jgi:ribulose 1,5-bisphosphate synthetase/thiazole synthase
MRYTLAPAILALVSQTLGAAVSSRQNSEVPKTDFDAIIVGGGPSGLSALSGLARVRRNVLLIDSGVYRNGPTRHLHDLIGLDGMSSHAYLVKG